MGAGEFGGDLEEKRERIASQLGRQDRIDKPARSGEFRVELVLVIGAHRVDGCRVVRFRGLPAIHGLHRRLSFHHTHAAGRPRDDEIGIESLPRHRIIPGTGGVIDGEDELGHRRCRHRFDEPRAGSNDTGVLRLGPDHESRHILNKEQRHALPVGILYEVRHLFGAFRVDDPADPWHFILLLAFDHPA